MLLTSLALAVLSHDPPSAATIAANLTMQPHAFNVPYIDMVYWTLVVEMKFYALTSLVIVRRQMKRVETLLTLWLAITAFAIWVKIPHWLDAIVMPTYASLFAGGCFLYLIRSRGPNVRRLIMFAVSIPLSMYWTLQYAVKYTNSTAFPRSSRCARSYSPSASCCCSWRFAGGGYRKLDCGSGWAA